VTVKRFEYGLTAGIQHSFAADSSRVHIALSFKSFEPV